MSEPGQNRSEYPRADPSEDPALRSPVRLQPNPAVGWLRFFVWLTPTAIFIGLFPLTSWLEHTISRSEIWGIGSFILGFVAVLSCGWFDSQLAVVCRSGIRHYGHHIILFVVTQILVIPAVLFAMLFATCLVGYY